MGDNIWSKEGDDDFELACPNCGATLVNGRCAECRTAYHHEEARQGGAPEPEPTESEPSVEPIGPPTESALPSVIEFDGTTAASEPESGSRSRWSAVLAVAVVLVVAVGLSFVVRDGDDPSDAAPRFGVIRSPEQLEQLFEYRTSGTVTAVTGSIDMTFVLLDRDRDNVVALNADGEVSGTATVAGDRLELDAYGDIAVVFGRGIVHAIDAIGTTLWETEGDTAEFVAESEVLVFRDRSRTPSESYKVLGARSGRTLRELVTQYKVPAVDAEFFAERRRGEVELFDRRLRLIQSFSALETNRWYYDGEYMVTAPDNRLRVHSLTGISRECTVDAMDTVSEVIPIDVGEYIVNGYKKDPDPDSNATTQISQRVRCTGDAGTLEVIWDEPDAWTVGFDGGLTNVQRHRTDSFGALDHDGAEVDLDVQDVFLVGEVAQDTYSIWFRPGPTVSDQPDSSGAPVRRLVRFDDQIRWTFDDPHPGGPSAWMIDGAVVAAEGSGDDTTLRFLGDS